MQAHLFQKQKHRKYNFSTTGPRNETHQQQNREQIEPTKNACSKYRGFCANLYKKSQAFLYNIETKPSIFMNAGPLISEAEAFKVQF